MRFKARLHAFRQRERVEIGNRCDLLQRQARVLPLAIELAHDGAAQHVEVVSSVEVEQRRSDLQRLGTNRLRCDQEDAATGRTATGTARAHSVGRDIGVAHVDAHVFGVNAKAVGNHLCEDGFIAVARAHQTA